MQNRLRCIVANGCVRHEINKSAPIYRVYLSGKYWSEGNFALKRDFSQGRRDRED